MGVLSKFLQITLDKLSMPFANSTSLWLGHAERQDRRCFHIKIVMADSGL
jgi:hypothetical protein